MESASAGMIFRDSGFSWFWTSGGYVCGLKIEDFGVGFLVCCFQVRGFRLGCAWRHLQAANDLKILRCSQKLDIGVKLGYWKRKWKLPQWVIEGCIGVKLG